MPHTLPSKTDSAALQARVSALVALFERIARTRMADVPVRNPALRVQALGFELCLPPPDAAGDAPAQAPAAIGILITPWFMNLVWLPLTAQADAQDLGCSRAHQIGAQTLDFIAGLEPGFGRFEACSLFSPMFEFADQAQALATAAAVLASLRQSATQAVVTPVKPVPASQADTGIAARRAFLFGRSAVAAGRS
jgi:[NiFe] hydrogenase assembly HybE family chaperone